MLLGVVTPPRRIQFSATMTVLLPPILDCRPSLNGKVAFVTGGFGGIGRACVAALAAHGARVAFSYAEGHESADDVARRVAEDPDHLSAHGLDLRHASKGTTSRSKTRPPCATK